MTKPKFDPQYIGLRVVDEEDSYSYSGVSNFEKVRDFHIKYGVPARYMEHDPVGSEILLRLRLVSEEFAELVAAMQLHHADPGADSFELVADSLADLLYVVYGTALYYGIPMDDVFREVHRSNMTKSQVKDPGGKIVKGDEFVPPDLRRVLWKKRTE